jgi:hypothetical protein
MKPNAGECGKPEFDVTDPPGSNTEKIVVATKAKFYVGGEMNSFFGARIPAAGGWQSPGGDLAVRRHEQAGAACRSGACRQRTATA